MNRIVILQEVRDRLKSGGFTGLYYPGECACTLDDLAPCGECQRDEGEEFINDCEPGHSHIDPEDPTFDIVSAGKEPPTTEQWIDQRARYK